MKIFINFIVLVKFFTVCFASGDVGFLDPLQTIDTFMGPRQTNVECHSTLYPHMNLALAVNCHPYNPNDVIGDKAFMCVAHPLVIKYNPELVTDMLPETIRSRLELLGHEYQFFLNVQDNPWNGTPVELRAHAYTDFFPAMNKNYMGVSVFVCRANGQVLLNEKGSVYPHGGIASPDNFKIAGLDHTKNEDFYSFVTYQGKTVITRHILLTVPMRETFQDCFSHNSALAPEYFTQLLKADYDDFLLEKFSELRFS
ncbi:MAG: hypothetical protein LW696_04265 [Alphaproteobacteria bacterium]|jgi:hypothetical protein|nr:hypothetical protein [Alphaproteobacteria bacterium]